MKKYLPLLCLSFLLIQCQKGPAPTMSPKADWRLITKIAPAIDESSGLAMANGQLWTHNDSGDGPFLYQIGQDEEKLIRKVFVANAQSVDWEELAVDSTHLYVGDFGNNDGDRKDLRIYKIALAALGQDSVQAETIRFRYPDQKRFDLGAYKHNHDCEAMIAKGDSLYLFSKNHQDKGCKLYSLPKMAGAYTAQLVDTFNTKGLITAAAYDASKDLVCLVGYEFSKGRHNPYFPFAWLLSDVDRTGFFNAGSRRLSLPAHHQTEGIESIGGGRFLISTEEKKGTKEAYLFEFNANAYLE